MRILKSISVGSAFAVLCLASAAFSVNASASMFSSTEAGKLTAKALETQTFVTNAGAVTCAKLAVLNTETATLSLEIHATVDYSECEAFGLGATITPALYLFLSSGEVHIVNSITVTAGLGSCVVLVPPQLVWTVKYSNSGTEVNLTPEVKSIKYTTEGAGCPAKGTFSNGTYEGKVLVKLASGTGTIKWEA